MPAVIHSGNGHQPIQDFDTPEEKEYKDHLVREAYSRDIAGHQSDSTHHIPVCVPPELRAGKILKAAEAIPLRAPICPPLTDAITLEHENFHEPQGLSFPRICPFCFQEERERAEAAEIYRLGAERLEREMLENGDKQQTGLNLMENNHERVHLKKHYIARSCQECQKMPEWEHKFRNPSGSTPTPSRRLRAEDPYNETLRTISISLNGCSIFVGSWSGWKAVYARWLGYELLQGSEDNPKRIPTEFSLSKEEMQSVESIVRKHIIRTGREPLPITRSAT